MKKFTMILCVTMLAACVRNETDRLVPVSPAQPPPAEKPKEATPEPWEIAPADPGPLSGKLRLMEYNVENLFDTVHDEGKNDWEFLPANTPGKKEFCASQPPQFQKKCLAADWTADKLQIKLNQIAKVVAKAGGIAPQVLPDLMALVEVENAGVVKLLADKLGYRAMAITESPDERGIDVALLFNEGSALKHMRTVTSRVDLSKVQGRPARDILAVEFLYGQKDVRKLVVLVNHWPSQANNPMNRQLFADRVREMSMAYARLGFDVIVTGDFNVDYFNDYPSPMRALEDVNGKTFLTDLDRETRLNPEKVTYDPATFAPGTYFYFNEGNKDTFPIMTWNLLDRFFLSPALLKRVDLNSYRILNDPEFATSATFRRGPQAGTVVSGIPRRYSHATAVEADAGFSDHFSIVMDLGYE